MSDISGLHPSDRLKTTVHQCLNRAFIVNNSTLGVIPSVSLNFNYLCILYVQK